MSRAAPLPRALAAQLGMELRLTLRRGETLLITLGVPLLLLLFFGSVPVLSAGEGRPVDFLVPGILALAVMSTGMVGLGIATAFERQYGVLKRLGGSPLPRYGLLLAKIGAVIVIVLLHVVLLTGAAGLVLGWQLRGANIWALLVVLLGTATFAGIGLLMAGALRAEATLAGANGLYLVLLLLGDMVFPLGQLPAGLASLARLLPAAALADALRATLQRGQPPPLSALAVLVVWGALAIGAAARTFQWE